MTLAAICAMSVVSACKKPDPEPNHTPSIEIKTQTILVPAGENAATFSFVANNDWTVTSSEDWCQVSPSSGNASENAAAVTVTLEPNETGETRSAKITIKAGSVEKQVMLAQAPEEVKPENIVINYIWNSQDDTKIENRQIEVRYSNWSANRGSYFTAIVQLDAPNPDLVLLPSDDAARVMTHIITRLPGNIPFISRLPQIPRMRPGPGTSASQPVTAAKGVL